MYKKVKDVIGEDGMRIIGAVGVAVAAGVGAMIAAKVMPKETPKAKKNNLLGGIFGKVTKRLAKQEDKVLEISETSESAEMEMLETEIEE